MGRMRNQAREYIMAPVRGLSFSERPIQMIWHTAARESGVPAIAKALRAKKVLLYDME